MKSKWKSLYGNSRDTNPQKTGIKMLISDIYRT